MLSTPGDLRQYIADVCPFLYHVPEIRSANDPSSSAYVFYRGEGTIGRKAVWVVLIDFTGGESCGAGGCAYESEILSIDQRTLFWAQAQYEFSSEVSGGEQWSASYSRFNRPITIRLPKIGSTTPRRD
jgi:hypothetical protein